MQILLRSIRLLLRPNVTAASAPMHRLSYHSPSRALLSFLASAPPWWPSALARGVFPLMAAPNPPVRRVSRSMTSGVGVKGEELDRPDRRLLTPSTNDKRDRNEGMHYVSDCELDSDGEEGWAEQIPSNAVDGIYPLYRIPMSRHRDGSLYRDTHSWKKEFCVADRNETRLEAMKLSEPADCVICDDGTCMMHRPCQMLQIFSLKLDKIHVDGGLVELYGYIAARDGLDLLLNHVINFSRDDPIIVEQGSFINIAGPKRGIELVDTILIEYDMRIKIGKQEKDDLQLIDGVSFMDDRSTRDCQIFTRRISGKCGSVEITASRLNWAVEATVEVLISEVDSSFNLRLGCFTSGLQKEIQIFDGAIGESGGLKRSVVAVRMGTSMDLKLKVGSESSVAAEHCCSFKANQHGSVSQEIKTDLALISVKVTWSTLPRGLD
ncbi:unnamed protein product [Urochloa decumbens]|uniref:DUF6598 domain-containing protein n=1 Tax=Urochloa decumbens TaxID=240449 RepID=A0ABC9EMQ7_9POAL